MEIREIIREMQPMVYKKLMVINEMNRVKPMKSDKNISEKVIKDLMGHSSYRRGSGGAIRQVR